MMHAIQHLLAVVGLAGLGVAIIWGFVIGDLSVVTTSRNISLRFARKSAAIYLWYCVLLAISIWALVV